MNRLLYVLSPYKHVEYSNKLVQMSFYSGFSQLTVFTTKDSNRNSLHYVCKKPRTSGSDNDRKSCRHGPLWPDASERTYCPFLLQAWVYSHTSLFLAITKTGPDPCSSSTWLYLSGRRIPVPKSNERIRGWKLHLPHAWKLSSAWEILSRRHGEIGFLSPEAWGTSGKVRQVKKKTGAQSDGPMARPSEAIVQFSSQAAFVLI